MTVKVEISSAQVEEAVRQYAERMMPPGWFECEGVQFALVDGRDGFVVGFKPIERPPEVYGSVRDLPQPGEAPAVDLREVAPASIFRDGNMEVGSNGVLVRV